MTAAALLPLLPLAFAAGLDLYLTLLLLGAATLTGWGGGLPGNLPDLGAPPLLAMAGIFYLLELAAEWQGPVSLFWNAVHALIRPLGAALLVLLALPGAASVEHLLLGLGAAAVAFLAHGGRFGTRQLLRLAAARPPSFILLSLGEDAVALGLVALALDAPAAGAATAAAALSAVVTVGRPALRASLFGLRLAWGIGWGTLSEQRWRSPADFPAWLRNSGPGDSLAPGGTLRGAPAAAWRIPGGGAFRTGWIVVTGTGPFFLYRRLGGVRSVPLRQVRVRRVVERFAFHRIELEGEGGTSFALLVPRDGPAPGILRGEFQRTPPAHFPPRTAGVPD